MNIGNKLSVVKTAVTSKAGRTLLQGQKKSPAILFGVGVIGVVATAVMSSKATLKVESIVTDHEDKLGDIREMLSLHEVNDSKEYTSADAKRDTAIVKARFVTDIARLYGPAVLVGALSIGALTGSHVILNRRYTGALAAYATIDKSFKDYRGRVTELYGSETEKHLSNGTVTRDVAADGENGVEVNSVLESAGLSPYAKLFATETSQEWSPQADYNLVYLRAQQTYVNDLLRTRGHVFLNEVYKALGLPHTKAGAVTGWVWTNKRGGDNFIDFGICDEPSMFNEFMASSKGAIWLDFNVDGIVYDLI